MASINRQSHIPSVKKTINRDFYSNISNNFLAPSTIKPPSIKYDSKPNSFGFNSAYKSQFAVPSSIGPFSTAKKTILSSRIPSTIKSANRGKITTFSNSVQKPATKLFGMTPQTNRISLLQNVSSTTRLSRASSLSGSSRPSTGSRQKDNRMLSDPTYQRECQEKIVDFLTMNGYSGQITRQNLVRLSLSDASKIFQFLFNFYDENIIIRNGIDTSLDVVVPRMMPIFCYPYPIKKSDLVSFTGGRQLGSVLSMIEYLIDFITYYSNVEMSRIITINDFGNYDEEDTEDEETNLNKLLPKIHDIVQQLDWDNINENDKLKCFTDLLVDVYGSEEEVDILKQEVDNMQQKLTKIDDELTYYTELPKSIQNLQNEIENSKVYYAQMVEHSNAFSSIKNALLGEIAANKEALKTLMNENKNLELKIASQKDVRNEYLYAIERQKQILEEIEAGEKRNKELEEEILALNLEIDKLKSRMDSFLIDINDMKNLFLLTANESRVYKFLPNRKLNLDEWQMLMEKLDKNKSIQRDNLDIFQELFRQIRTEFSQIKAQLVENSSQLKNTALLEVVSKFQQWKKTRDQQQQEIADLDGQIQLLWEEKNELDDRHRNECKTLNDQVEKMTKESINYEKFFNGKESSSKNVTEQIQMLEHEIINKKSTIMKTFDERKNEFQNYEHRLLSIIDKNQLIVEKRCQQIEKIIENLRNI